jgi:hypothetical protein
MHGHGYALLFLTQIYGMAKTIPGFDMESLKEKIVKAVRCTEQAQALNGGWWYNPVSGGDEGSVTITQVAALRAARDIGIAVNKKTIDKAIDYINKSTDSSGMTHYSLRGGHTTYALTAAGMSVLNYLGQYDNPKVKKGIKYLLRSGPVGGGAWRGWFFYGNFYATVAMFQAGGKYWKKWFPKISKVLLRKQSSNGAWGTDESASYGAGFGTGFALLMLQMPYRYLPIFQAPQD